MMNMHPRQATADTPSPSCERPGWLPWWRRTPPDATAGPLGAPRAERTGLAHHEPERRRRLAAAAGRALERSLPQATQALFQSVVRLDELAAQAQDEPDVRVDTASLRAVQDRMNDALQHCDQLALLVDNLQRLLDLAPPAPRPFDPGLLLSQATYCVHGLLPAGLTVVNRLPALAPVCGDRAEIMQALVDALMQIGACATAQGRLELDGGHEHGIVWVELRVTGADASQRPGLALETAVETLARHRGALDFPPADDGTVVLRLRLPAAR